MICTTPSMKRPRIFPVISCQRETGWTAIRRRTPFVRSPEMLSPPKIRRFSKTNITAYPGTDCSKPAGIFRRPAKLTSSVTSFFLIENSAKFGFVYFGLINFGNDRKDSRRECDNCPPLFSLRSWPRVPYRYQRSLRIRYSWLLLPLPSW